MKIKGKLLSALIAVFTITASFFVSKPAWALCAYDAPCCGDSCRGWDPRLSGCERGAHYFGGKSVKSGGKIVATVYLVHSPRCNSSWSEIESYGPSSLSAVALLTRSGVGVVARSGNTLFQLSNAYTVRSPMAAAGAYMQSGCGMLFDDPLDDPITGGCTDYFHGLP